LDEYPGTSWTADKNGKLIPDLHDTRLGISMMTTPARGNTCEGLLSRTSSKLSNVRNETTKWRLSRSRFGMRCISVRSDECTRMRHSVLGNDARDVMLKGSNCLAPILSKCRCQQQATCSATTTSNVVAAERVQDQLTTPNLWLSKKSKNVLLSENCQSKVQNLGPTRVKGKNKIWSTHNLLCRKNCNFLPTYFFHPWHHWLLHFCCQLIHQYCEYAV